MGALLVKVGGNIGRRLESFSAMGAKKMNEFMLATTH